MPDSASRRGGRPSSPGGCHPPGPRRQTPLQKGLVLIAHGSADPRAAAAIGELMPLVARRATERGLVVPDLRVAYLGHAAPSVPQVMRAFGPDAQVTVLPLLLTAAYHSKTDIPRLLARVSAGMRVTYGEPLGPHPLLLGALERRLPPAAFDNPAEVGVVLAAAGSSDPEANATVARLAAHWQARTGWYAVRPAYASPAATGGQDSTAATGGQDSTAATGAQGSAACPDPATAVTGLLRAGARRVVVASYLLAPGLFADRIRAASLAAGAAATSPALLPWPPAAADAAASEVADVVLDRYQEASTRERAAA
jgi:sirohydrochlorin ferrochelatase